ncbi:MAG TPA: bacteriocin [Leptolyngbyaceae cyanobacterium]
MSEENIDQFLSVATDDEQLSEELSEKELKSVAGGSDSSAPLLVVQAEILGVIEAKIALGGGGGPGPSPTNN